MIIHGDNLEALKALLPQYEGKVKCYKGVFANVKVLVENHYGSRGEYVGLDVKAMRTTSDEDSYEHLRNSLNVFKALEEKVARWDYDYTGRLIAERKFEQLEMRLVGRHGIITCD